MEAIQAIGITVLVGGIGFFSGYLAQYLVKLARFSKIKSEEFKK